MEADAVERSPACFEGASPLSPFAVDALGVLCRKLAEDVSALGLRHTVCRLIGRGTCTRVYHDGVRDLPVVALQQPIPDGARRGIQHPSFIGNEHWEDPLRVAFAGLENHPPERP